MPVDMTARRAAYRTLIENLAPVVEDLDEVAGTLLDARAALGEPYPTEAGYRSRFDELAAELARVRQSFALQWPAVITDESGYGPHSPS